MVRSGLRHPPPSRRLFGFSGESIEIGAWGAIHAPPWTRRMPSAAAERKNRAKFSVRDFGGSICGVTFLCTGRREIVQLRLGPGLSNLGRSLYTRRVSLSRSFNSRGDARRLWLGTINVGASAEEQYPPIQLANRKTQTCPANDNPA